MDVVSSVATVIGLVFNFATAAKTCNDIRGRYKGAARTIDSLKHELETLQGALQELANLMMHDASALASRWDTNKTLSRTFARAMKGFERTIKGLQAELEGLKGEKREITSLEKVKVIWNEDGMRQHLDQLRGQASALQLLLQVLHA
jgi:DNA repair ATPase RecN